MEPMKVDLYQGHVLDVLAALPGESIQCCLTSPPYWGLRDYGLPPILWPAVRYAPMAGQPAVEVAGCDPECEHEWISSVRKGQTGGKMSISAGGILRPHNRSQPEQGDICTQHCHHCHGWRGSLGLEPTIEAYVGHLVLIFQELRRVMRNDAVAWLNLGDSYSSQMGPGQTIHGRDNLHGKPPARSHRRNSLKPKQLLGIPWRVAFALQADGWWLRSDIVWAKGVSFCKSYSGSSMPESVRDRPSKSHEYVFLLSKQKRYYYDAEAVKEQGVPASEKRYKAPFHVGDKEKSGQGRPGEAANTPGRKEYTGTRNLRSVWTINPAAFPGSHFACVDEETECLTLTGWKHYTELQRGELLAAYDIENHKLHYERMQDLAVYEYDDRLYQLGGAGLGVLCTPNHRCIVRTRAGTVSIRRADALVGGLEVPCAAEWEDGTFFATNDPGPVVAELLGWAVTDGTFLDTAVSITQSVTANSVKVARIEKVLDDSGFHYKKHIRTRGSHSLPNGTVCKSYQVATFSITGIGERLLKSFCDSSKTPMWTCALWSKESIRALLDGIVGGDGHVRTDGRVTLIQKQKAFLDMVQYLYLRLGTRTTLSTSLRHGKEMWMLYVRKRQWHSLRGTNGLGAVINQPEYKGKVWCPSMPSGTFVARRNGRIWITGNTFPPKLVEPMIRAGTSERGCCPECGSPWVRVAERERHSTRPGNPIKVAEGRNDATSLALRLETTSTTTSWQPTCKCGIETTTPCVVLDPFLGSGTTGLVCIQEGRNFIGIELNEEYLEMARERIKKANQERRNQLF